MTTRFPFVGLLVAAALLVVAPAPATAQVSPADVAAFMGVWTITIDTPQGSMSMDLTVKDVSGKVAGVISSDLFPEQEITDVTKTDQSLVLTYAADIQGNQFPIKLILTPDGDKMKMTFDAADGQLVMDGSAVKK
jgi:hypothetical protein